MEGETLLKWIIGGGLIGLMAVILKNNKDNDGKISRVYKRLDAVKDKNDITYTKKDVCEVVHKSVNEKLECIPEIKNKVTQIATKIDILLKNNGH